MMNCLPLHRRSPKTQWLKFRRRKIFVTDPDGLVMEGTNHGDSNVVETSSSSSAAAAAAAVPVPGSSSRMSSYASTSEDRDFLDKTIEIEMMDDEEDEDEEVKAELQNRLDAIMALRSVVLKQREKLNSMKTKERDFKLQIRNLKRLHSKLAYDHSSVPPQDDRKRVVRFAPTNDKVECTIQTPTYSFDSNSTNNTNNTNTNTNTDPEFKDSIRSIVRRASQIDNAIVLEDLDSARSELIELRNKLHNKNDAIQTLQAQLSHRDSRVATLVLEKELLQADNQKLKADLKALSSIDQTPQTNLSPPSILMETPHRLLPLPSSSDSPVTTRSTDKRLRQFFRGARGQTYRVSSSSSSSPSSPPSLRQHTNKKEHRSHGKNLGIRPDSTPALLCFRCTSSNRRHHTTQDCHHHHHHQTNANLVPMEEGEEEEKDFIIGPNQLHCIRSLLN